MKYYKRGFLNKSVGLAAFEAHVDTQYSEDNCFDASFVISDCNRQVSLDFAVYAGVPLKQQIHKVEALMRELEAFKEQMLVASMTEQ